jgi:hypothetical protein
MDWSPKSGCTIAVKMFFKQMGLLEEALAHHVWIHEYRMHVFSKKHPVTLDDLRAPDIYKFKVVRNPYSRAVSSYIHTMRKEVMHPPVKKTLHRWNANISFRKFVDYLGKIDIQHCDPHYALQKRKFESAIQPCFDKIVKLENIENEIVNLNNQLNFQFYLTGITSHHHIEKNQELSKNVSGKRWSKVKDNIPGYQFFYTDEIRRKVSEIYKADLEAYGYTFEELLEEA